MSKEIDINKNALELLNDLIGDDVQSRSAYLQTTIFPTEKVICEYVKCVIEAKASIQSLKTRFLDKYKEVSVNDVVRNFDDFVQVGSDFLDRIKSMGPKSQNYLVIRCVYALHGDKFDLSHITDCYKKSLLEEDSI